MHVYVRSVRRAGAARADGTGAARGVAGGRASKAARAPSASPCLYQAVRPHTLASRGQGLDEARAADGDGPTRRARPRRDASARLSPRGAASPPPPWRCAPAVPRDGQSAPAAQVSESCNRFGGGAYKTESPSPASATRRTRRRKHANEGVRIQGTTPRSAPKKTEPGLAIWAVLGTWGRPPWALRRAAKSDRRVPRM